MVSKMWYLKNPKGLLPQRPDEEPTATAQGIGDNTSLSLPMRANSFFAFFPVLQISFFFSLIIFLIRGDFLMRLLGNL